MKYFYLSLLFILAVPVFSQVDFRPDIFSQGNYQSFVNSVVDMNGDFLDDIVGINQGIITINYQLPSGGFKTKKFRQQFQSLPFWSVTAADIDANGFNDLLFSDSATISFLKSGANGNEIIEDYRSEFIFGQRGSFADIDNDGHLDAFVCNDVDQNHPYRNDGSGNLILDFNLLWTPEDVPGNYAVTWVDYDNDWDTDMYLTKCVQDAFSGDPSRTNLLYQNDGSGNYTEVGAVAGLDDNDQSWVTVFEDMDNDGDFDAIILNHEFKHRFMSNNGDGTFTDVLDQTGILGEVSLVREALAADFDNNGYMDFMIDEPPKVYYNQGGLNFIEEDLNFFVGALGDLNADGFIDNIRFNQVFINEGNDNHWLSIDLIGRESNRNGIGARLELYGDWGVMIREVRSTQGYQAMSTLSSHFGLGSHDNIDSLVIKWPSKIKTLIIDPAIDQKLIIDEADCPTSLMPLVLSGSSELCAGESLTMSLQTSNQVVWSDGQVGTEITISESGNYNATVTDPNGCTQLSESIEVTKSSDPVQVYAPWGSEFCGSGGVVLLEVDVAGSLTWSTGEVGSFIYVSEAGDYDVTVTSSCPEPIVSEAISVEVLEVEPPIVMDTYIESGGDEIFTVSVESDALMVTWFSDDLVYISDGTTNIFSKEFITGDTTFYVQACEDLNGSFCCSELVPINIFFLTNVDFEEELGLDIYPNPVSDELIIEFTDIKGEIEYEFLDPSGRSLDQSRTIKNKTTTINTSEYDSGLYFLKFRYQGAEHYQKILVAH